MARPPGPPANKPGTALPVWARPDPASGGWRLFLHVQPGAKKSAVAGVYGERLKIRVAAPPLDGRANAALLAFLGETLGVPKSRLTIAQGESGRDKTVLVPELDAATLARLAAG